MNIVKRVQYSFQFCLQGGKKEIIELGPFTEVMGLHMRPGARNELVGFKTEEHGAVIQLPVEWFDPIYANLSPYRGLVTQKFSKPSMMALEFTNQSPDMMVVITGVLIGALKSSIEPATYRDDLSSLGSGKNDEA